MEATTLEQWQQAAAVKTLDLSEMDLLVRQSLDLWGIHEEKKKIESEARKNAEAVDLKIMQALKDAGKTKYFVDGVGTFSIRQKPIVRVPGSLEAKLTFFEHLKAQGLDVFLSLASVSSQSLNSWYSEKLDEALKNGNTDFSVPGIEAPTMRETLCFNADKKGKKQ